MIRFNREGTVPTQNHKRLHVEHRSGSGDGPTEARYSCLACHEDGYLAVPADVAAMQVTQRVPQFGQSGSVATKSSPPMTSEDTSEMPSTHANSG